MWAFYTDRVESVLVISDSIWLLSRPPTEAKNLPVGGSNLRNSSVHSETLTVWLHLWVLREGARE